MFKFNFFKFLTKRSPLSPTANQSNALHDTKEDGKEFSLGNKSTHKSFKCLCDHCHVHAAQIFVLADYSRSDFLLLVHICFSHNHLGKKSELNKPESIRTLQK